VSYSDSYFGVTADERRRDERQNAAMAKTTAERQADFKRSMKEAGYVKLEAWVTKEQREKFRAIGGDEWLRKKINAAKETNAAR
jgi:hypothetical protein